MPFRVSCKRKFVADGVFYCELNELFSRFLAGEGYAGVELRKAPNHTSIVIRATRPQDVVGENGRRIRELTSVVEQRFHIPSGTVELFAERVGNRGLCAQTQAESLKYKLLGGLAARRAAYGVLRFVMESGAKGCEVVIAGKLRGQRAKKQKYIDGYMIKAGHAQGLYVDRAVRHVLLKQGVLGVKVKIMKPYDVRGLDGPRVPLPDDIRILDPKEFDMGNGWEEYERRLRDEAREKRGGGRGFRGRGRGFGRGRDDAAAGGAGGERGGDRRGGGRY